MDLEEELVEIGQVGVGLERSHITNEGQIELPERNHESSDSDTATVQDPANHVPTDARSTTHRVYNKVKLKKHIAGIKLRKTLHIGRPVDEDEESATKSLVLVDTAEVKQSKSRLDDKSTASEKHTIKEVFNCPIDTLKHKGWCQGKSACEPPVMGYTWRLVRLLVPRYAPECRVRLVFCKSSRLIIPF